MLLLGTRYAFSEDGIARLRKDLDYMFKHISIDNIESIDSTDLDITCKDLKADNISCTGGLLTAGSGYILGDLEIGGEFGCNSASPSSRRGLSANLSTVIGGSSDLNRTNSIINEIKNLLIRFGLGSS